MILSHFTNPKLLADIAPGLLSKFLSLFQDDSVHPTCALPVPRPVSQVDFAALAARFGDRSLPRALCTAAAEIEEAAAAPEKIALLEQLMQALPANLSLPADLHPVHRSLQLWLWMADGLISPRRELFPLCVRSFAPCPAPKPRPTPQAPAAPNLSAPARSPESFNNNHDSHEPDPTLPPLLPFTAIASLRRNKILHFPSQVVETIHVLLQKQCTFAEISAAIGQYGPLVNPSNLSRFKKSRPHRDWLREQRARDRLQFQVRSVLGLSTNSDPARLQRAAHDAAAIRICQAITSCNPAVLSQTLQQDPATLLSLLKILPQLTQGAMEIERKSVKIDAARKRSRRGPGDKRGISEESLGLAEEKLNLM